MLDIQYNQGRFKHRLLLGIPSTGMNPIRCSLSWWGAVTPVNWSFSLFTPVYDIAAPIGYAVAEARNQIVAKALAEGHEYTLMVDHDVEVPPDFFVRFNEYMTDPPRVPIVSGLYYAKTWPDCPLVFRGRRGWGAYTKWKRGDLVWADGCGCGMLLVHTDIFRAMKPPWFVTPRIAYQNPESDLFVREVGTEDLYFFGRVLDEDVIGKAGWPEISAMKFPILIDTSIFGKHIADDGRSYPLD